MKQILLTFIFFINLTTVAYADCIFEGVSYPEGTRLGSLICKDGTWQPR